MENTQVSVVQAASLSQYKPETLAVLKSTVAKGASNEELGMFLTLAGKYKLDPFAKEIFFIKRGDGSVTIMTSRDGYLAIAQRNPEFEGLISGTVRAKDEFEFDAINGVVKHKPNIMDGSGAPIVGAWALAYRKGKKPATVYVPFSEYKQSSTTWTKYPSAMIEKVAEARALKRQFGISGLVTQDEMDETPVHSMPTEGLRTPYVAVGTDVVEAEPVDAPTFKRGVEKVYDMTVEKVAELLALKGENADDAEQFVIVKIKHKCDGKSPFDLSKKEMEDILGDVVVALEAVKKSQEESKVEETVEAEAEPVVDTEEVPASEGNLSEEQVAEMFGVPDNDTK